MLGLTQSVARETLTNAVCGVVVADSTALRDVTTVVADAGRADPAPPQPTASAAIIPIMPTRLFTRVLRFRVHTSITAGRLDRCREFPIRVLD
jgi:hypothetical protein